MFAKIFKRGALAIAPITITLALIIWLFSFLENTFSPLVIFFIGKSHYIRGMGTALALIVLFCIGVLINLYLVQKLMQWFEAFINKIPLVKSIYKSIQEVTHYINTSTEENSQKVVKVEFNEFDIIGFVTRQNFDDLPQLGEQDEVFVYFPMSYQLGGYTVVVKKSQITPLSMTVKEALEFILIAGAKTIRKK